MALPRAHPLPVGRAPCPLMLPSNGSLRLSGETRLPERKIEQPMTLVLLPGLDGTDVFYRPLLAALPACVRPLVIQFPCSGPSDYEGLLHQVRAASAELPEYYLLGSSFSGPLAVMLAAAEPERVRGLILSATFLRSPRPRLRRLRFATIGPVVWALRLARRIPLWLSRPRHDAHRQAKAETWSRVSAACLAERARAALGVDVREALRRYRRPVLCVAFAEDTVVPRANAEEIAREAPQAKLVTLPGGHLAMSIDARPLAQAIGHFLASGPPDG